MTIELSLLVFLPVFVGSAVLAARRFPLLACCISFAGAISHFACALLVFLDVLRGGARVEQLGGWIAPFGISLVADLLSAALALIASTIISTGLLFGPSPREAEWEYSLFHPMLHVELAGLCGAFLTGDLFNLFVWFEVVLIASFVLMAKSSDRATLAGSFKYVVLNLVGSAAFLTSLGLIYGAAGTLNMADLSTRMTEGGLEWLALSAAGLLMFAFLAKAAIFPLCFWLPAAYHNISPAISAVFAGLLTKLGLYAFLRVSTLVFPPSLTGLQWVFIAMACCSMVFGVAGAAGAKHGRRILSFHIVSQVGYLFLGFAVASRGVLTATLYYFVHHILAKANLFLIAGICEQMTGRTSVYEQGGMLRKSRLAAGAFVVSAGALAGLPPFSGFFAKFSLMLGLAREQRFAPLAVCALVGFMTLFSMAKVWNESYLKPPPDGREEDRDGSRRVGARPYLAISLLSMLSLILAAAAPFAFAVCDQIASQVLSPELYRRAVLAAGGRHE